MAAETRSSRDEPSGQLALRDVSKSYVGPRGTVDALREVHLVVPAREFLSIIGPSGCGKSTLLNITAGIVSPTSGEVLVDGEPVKGPGADRGMVFQQYANLPWRTVLENAELGLKIRGVRVADRRERARRVLDMVGLTGFEDKYPRELSGGMQQRVAIARVLVSDPRVILLDEPFGALDAQTRELLQEDMVKMWEGDAKTIMHVTHSIEEACFLADRIVIMTARPGRIKKIVRVDLARPRSRGKIGTSLQYVRLCEEIRELVREEVLVAMKREKERGERGRGEGRPG